MTLKYFFEPEAVEELVEGVQLEFPNPDQPIALADLAELFKYNVWRKIAKHLGLSATGKLQDIVDRVVAMWLERGDLVPFVPPPPKKKMQVEDWIASKPSPSSPSDQVASKRDVRSFADWFQEKRIEDAERQEQLRREDLERMERAEKHQHTMMSMLKEHGTKIEQHDVTLEDQNVDRIAQLEALGFDFNPTGMTFDTSGDATSSAGGKGIESIPSDDVNDPSASPVPPGGTNDPVVPRETIVADRLPIVADVLAKSGLDLFQMDLERVAKFILGDEASPVLVAKMTDLLRQGHPGINFLISSPTPRPREAAMILLEGALLHDTTVACAEAVLSIPGIQDFVSADPSNASLLFLGTNPSSDLVGEVSDYLSSESFQAILRHSTTSAASNLDNLIVTHTAEATRIAALRDEGRELYLERRYQKSVVQFSSALRIRTRNFTVTPRLGRKDLLLAQILGNRAAALLMVGAFDPAASDCRKGLEQIPDATAWDLKADSGPALSCRLLGRSGRALLKAGNVDAAEEAFDGTIRIANETFARYGRDNVDPKAVKLLDQSIINASLDKTDARRFRVEKSEINKLCSGLPPNVAAHRQILAHVKTALELAPGDVELHSYIVQLFAGMKRWADLALHCERFASDCVKLDGVFVGDLTGLNPFPSAPRAQTLKGDHFDLSVWDVATNAPKLLSEKAVGEAVLRMPVSMLPLYLRALRLEERYAEGGRALSVLLASAREGNRADYPITWLEREQKKRIRTCTSKDDGDALYHKGQYEEAAAKYADCFLVDAKGEDIATADGSNGGGRLHAVLHCNRAACFMSKKQYREAAKECTAALDIHPSYMKAMLRLARCYSRLQRYEEAVSEYRRWIFLAEAAKQNPQRAASEYDATCYFDKPSDATADDIEKAQVELR